MKRIFSSHSSAEVGLLGSQLQAAGIPCELRNEALSQAMPVATFDVELWVLNDDDYREASDLVAAWRAPASNGGREK